MAGVTHVGVTHDYGRTLVGLRIGEDVVSELAKLAQHRLYVGIALGVAAAAVGVHVGDIDVDDNAFCYLNFIMPETLFDAGISTASESTVFICILHHLFPSVSSRAIALAGNCQALFPEEAETVCVGARRQLCGGDSTSVSASIVI